VELLGVSFLRFDAMRVINNIEAVLNEIREWIMAYEEKNGVSKFVLSKRDKQN
jgi:very-short-patch-repair endonuclease